MYVGAWFGWGRACQEIVEGCMKQTKEKRREEYIYIDDHAVFPFVFFSLLSVFFSLLPYFSFSISPSDQRLTSKTKPAARE